MDSADFLARGGELMGRLVELRELLDGESPNDGHDVASVSSAQIGLLLEAIRLEERTMSEELSELIQAFRSGE